MNSKGEFNRSELPRIIVELPPPPTKIYEMVDSMTISQKVKHVDTKMWGLSRDNQKEEQETSLTCAGRSNRQSLQ